MSDLIVVNLRYLGRRAKESRLDGREFGESLLGATRVYNLVGHALITGSVPGSRSNLVTRTEIGAPHPGSLMADLAIGLANSAPAMAAYLTGNSTVVQAALSQASDLLMNAIQAVWRGEESDMKAALEAIKTLTDKHLDAQTQNNQIAAETLRQHMADSGETTRLAMHLLHDLATKRDGQSIQKLADVSRPAARRMVEPVDRSCQKMRHRFGAPKDRKVIFDHHDAAALRDDTIEIEEEEQEFRLYVVALDKTRRVGRFEFHHESPIYAGRIVDERAGDDHSVYSQALDSGERIIAQAVPVVSIDGELRRFIIKSAKSETPGAA